MSHHLRLCSGAEAGIPLPLVDQSVENLPFILEIVSEESNPQVFQGKLKDF